jgi:feruloyl esterase
VRSEAEPCDLLGMVRNVIALIAALGVCGVVNAADSNACASMQSASFVHTRIAAAVNIAADSAQEIPAFCEVRAIISPVANSSIGVVYRLPERWNGKMLGLGGGGWAGNIQLSTATPGLKSGYATAQTDGGHAIPTRFEDIWRPDTWGANPQAMTDFHHRAIHLMTTIGKEVVAKYYGRSHTKAYFHGCSTGGRQGLMEVQRYPADYDGVISMAPVYSLSVQTSAAVRNNILGAPGAALSVEQLNRVNTAVMQACDSRDGVADGLLADPRQCSWDPAEMQCSSGPSAAVCLTPPQVDALRKLYRGVKTRDGRFVSWPLSRGSESSWPRYIGISGMASDATSAGGLARLVGPVFGNESFDLANFDPDKDYDTVSNSAFAKTYEARDANIAAFVNRGGKLLLWHGWNDAGPSPWLTIDYFEQVAKTFPDATRLFLSPGVEHCAGGSGPDQFDAVAALDAWVQTGRAPGKLLTTKASPKMSRPVCAYPAVARYQGSGDPNAEASFECK